MTPEIAVDPGIARTRGPGELPRQNGELVFGAPWEGRAFAMGVATIQALGLEWEDFRLRLVAAIDAELDRPYYESWLSALEELVEEET